MKGINRNTVLKEMQDMAWNNVFCYSQNYAMTEPKDGMREEWEQAMSKAKIIDQMLVELPEETTYCDSERRDYFRRYTGSIDGWSCNVTRTEDPHPYVDTVEFEIAGIGHGVSDSDRRIFRIDHQLGIDYLLSGKYDVERHARYGEGKGHTIGIVVDNLGYIREFRWLD